MIWETDRNTGTTREPASLPDYLDFKTRSRTFERLAAMTTGEVNLTPEAGDPVRLPQLMMSADALPMLGVQPLVGRTFTPEEDRPGGPDVVLISESLWERSFGRRSSVVGQTLRLDDRPNVIVGVMPKGADFGVLQILSAAAYSRGFADRGMKTDVDIWAPLQGDVQQLPRSTHPIFVLGRLATGATHDGAQSEMTAIAADLERAYPENAARGVHVEPLETSCSVPCVRRSSSCLRPSRLVLLVACVNVANLLLARRTRPRAGGGVRCALGATQAGWSAGAGRNAAADADRAGGRDRPRLCRRATRSWRLRLPMCRGCRWPRSTSRCLVATLGGGRVGRPCLWAFRPSRHVGSTCSRRSRIDDRTSAGPARPRFGACSCRRAGTRRRPRLGRGAADPKLLVASAGESRISEPGNLEGRIPIAGRRDIPSTSGGGRTSRSSMRSTPRCSRVRRRSPASSRPRLPGTIRSIQGSQTLSRSSAVRLRRARGRKSRSGE